MATYFVDSINGDNTNDGLTPSTAKSDFFSLNGTPSEENIVWVRKSSTITLVENSSISFIDIRFWPEDGDATYDDRPQEGIDAGWDDDTKVSILDLGTYYFSVNEDSNVVSISSANIVANDAASNSSLFNTTSVDFTIQDSTISSNRVGYSFIFSLANGTGIKKYTLDNVTINISSYVIGSYNVDDTSHKDIYISNSDITAYAVYYFYRPYYYVYTPDVETSISNSTLNLELSVVQSSISESSTKYYNYRKFSITFLESNIIAKSVLYWDVNSDSSYWRTVAPIVFHSKMIKSTFNLSDYIVRVCGKYTGAIQNFNTDIVSIDSVASIFTTKGIIFFNKYYDSSYAQDSSYYYRVRINFSVSKIYIPEPSYLIYSLLYGPRLRLVNSYIPHDTVVASSMRSLFYVNQESGSANNVFEVENILFTEGIAIGGGVNYSELSLVDCSCSYTTIFNSFYGLKLKLKRGTYSGGFYGDYSSVYIDNATIDSSSNQSFKSAYNLEAYNSELNLSSVQIASDITSIFQIIDSTLDMPFDPNSTSSYNIYNTKLNGIQTSYKSKSGNATKVISAPYRQGGSDGSLLLSAPINETMNADVKEIISTLSPGTQSASAYFATPRALSPAKDFITASLYCYTDSGDYTKVDCVLSDDDTSSWDGLVIGSKYYKIVADTSSIQNISSDKKSYFFIKVYTLDGITKEFYFDVLIATT